MPHAASVLALLATVLLAACGGSGATSPTPTMPGEPEPTAVPGSTSAVSDDPLVVLETRGGECPQGPCGIRVVIGRDGSVERSDGMAQRVDAVTMDRLVELVATTDWDAVVAIPFEGECPVNVDGQEQVFTFLVDGQAVVVASCTTAIDASAEPFATVLEIVFGTGG